MASSACKAAQMQQTAAHVVKPPHWMPEAQQVSVVAVAASKAQAPN